MCHLYHQRTILPRLHPTNLRFYRRLSPSRAKAVAATLEVAAVSSLITRQLPHPQGSSKEAHSRTTRRWCLLLGGLQHHQQSTNPKQGFPTTPRLFLPSGIHLHPRERTKPWPQMKQLVIDGESKQFGSGVESRIHSQVCEGPISKDEPPALPQDWRLTTSLFIRHSQPMRREDNFTVNH